jgi:8-oxo-dGTP pyrophosphatase MutT (NUDIX family)
MRFEHAQVARVAYAAIRQLREETGCRRGPVWNLLGQDEQGWYLRAVERARRGMVPELIHDSWYEEMTAAGWVYGREVDHARKTHPELVPWHHLDEKYRILFISLQYQATALTLEVPPCWGTTSLVTAT